MLSFHFKDFPLSEKALAVRDRLLAIPITDDVLAVEWIPAEYEGTEKIAVLQHESINGTNYARAALTKLVKQYPECPVFFNFLYITHTMRKEHRQQQRVLVEMQRLHPDYLFTRLSCANHALNVEDDAEQAKRWLGEDLDLAALYPKREIFHVSEFCHFNITAAIIHLHLDDSDSFLGTAAAVESRATDSSMIDVLKSEWQKNNSLFARMGKDKLRRISVKPEPVQHSASHTPSPLPTHHAELAPLRETWWCDINEATFDAIHALPQDTLIDDLNAIVTDAILNFTHWREQLDPECPWIINIHTLMIEIDPLIALNTAIRFLELHPSIAKFWFDEFLEYLDITITDADLLPVCFNLLRRPGVAASNKMAVIEGIEKFANSAPPALCNDIADALADILDAIIHSPPDANLIDTETISRLCVTLSEFQPARHDDLIREADAMGLLEHSFAGTAAEMIRERESPTVYQPKPGGMNPSWSEVFDDDDESPAEPDFEGVSRNDPCPCGSGKKFKKCCMR